MTTTMEVIVVLAGLGNIAWSFHNWQVQTKLDDLIARAEENLKRARGLSSVAAIEQEHKVCSECERIVTKHSTDENGKTTCINCTANLASLAPTVN